MDENGINDPALDQHRGKKMTTSPAPQTPATDRFTPKPLEIITEADLVRQHALVYGKCRFYYHNLTDRGPETHSSRWGWWKAMWYSHKGPPSSQRAWGIYGGDFGYTGPGDATITHWLPMPDAPAGAPTGFEP